MYNYKLIVSYDGTRYNGFQRLSQHPERTIQGKLEMALSALFEAPIQIVASGRTDAGVHAREQVCNFHSEKKLAPGQIHQYLITYLPKDLAVLSVSECAVRFHARYNAVKKLYRYTIDNAPVADPFMLRFAYHIKEPLNLSAMKEASSYLLGTHDFTSFTSMKSKKKSCIRTLYHISIEPLGSLIQISYEADGFLQHMVRILTGTLIEVGLGKRKPESLINTLESLTRSQAGPLVPSLGLCLDKVFYH